MCAVCRLASGGHQVFILDTSNAAPVDYGDARIQTLHAYLSKDEAEMRERHKAGWRETLRRVNVAAMLKWGDKILARLIDEKSEIVSSKRRAF